MRVLILLLTLTALALPAYAQEDETRTFQMEVLKENFNKRREVQRIQGNNIPTNTPSPAISDEQSRQQNQMLRNLLKSSLQEKKAGLGGQ